MNRTLQAFTLAMAVSLTGTAAFACDGDCCCKDKAQATKEACCEKMPGKMKDMQGMKAAPKPDAATPATPAANTDHKH